MQRFLSSNPGLRSRFAREIVFPDYSTEELLEITRRFVAEHEYVLGEGAEATLSGIFGAAPRTEGFGNARFARTIFEQAVNMHALRLARAGLDQPSLAELQTLTDEDVRAAARALGEDPVAAESMGRGLFRRRRPTQ
jgi:stage V sporulation protein K